MSSFCDRCNGFAGGDSCSCRPYTLHARLESGWTPDAEEHTVHAHTEVEAAEKLGHQLQSGECDLTEEVLIVTGKDTYRVSGELVLVVDVEVVRG